MFAAFSNFMSESYDPGKLVFEIVESLKLEFPDARELNNLLSRCFLVGSKVLLNNNSDTDVYYYDNSPNRERNIKRLEYMLNKAGLTDPDSLNIDIHPPLATSDYFSINDPSKTLTDYLFSEKKEVFTEQKRIMRMLNHKGLFITKLTAIIGRDADKDFDALSVLYKEFNEKLPKEVEQAIQEYGVQKGLNKFLKQYNNN